MAGMETMHNWFESSSGFFGMVGDYKKPFLDLATLNMPESLEDFYKLSLYIYYTNPIIRMAISKLAEYAVTDLEYKGVSTTVTDKWKYIFEKVIKIKRLLIRIGLDAFIGGNCIATLNFPVVRKFECPHCAAAEKDRQRRAQAEEAEPDYDVFSSAGFGLEGGKSHRTRPAADIRLNTTKLDANAISDLTYKSSKFHGTCPVCGVSTDFDATEEYDISENSVVIKTWPQNLCKIKNNPWTQGERIYWNPPNVIKSSIKEGDMDVVNATPMQVLDCIAQDKPVELNNVYHFVLQGPTDEYSEWGKGLIVCAFKTVYFLDILKRASEAIAQEHITPFRMLAPVDIEATSAFALMPRLKEFLLEEFQTHKSDPNYITFSPLPVQEIYFGGKGRAFMPMQEISLATDDMLLGFGLPRGLITGEATWAGNTISLRIIENFFLTHRDQLQDFIDWIEDKLRVQLNIPRCEVKMREFKMLDDMQHKQMLLDMVSARLLPAKTIIEMEGFDYKDVQEQLEKEIKEQARMQAEAANTAASIQSKHQQDLMEDQQAAMVQAMQDQQQQLLNQTVSSIENMMLQYKIPMDQAIQMAMAIQQQQMMMQQMSMLQMQADQAKQLFLMDRMGQAQWSNIRAQREGSIQNMMQMAPNMNPMTGTGNSIYDIANTVVTWDPQSRDEFLSRMNESNPTVGAMLEDYLNSIGIPLGQPNPMVAQGNNRSQPLPTQRPPRRAGNFGR